MKKQGLKTIGVIPARYGSTRFPGKPLFMIEGRPLIEWVIRGAKSAKSLDAVLVATDHEGIAKVSRAAGAEVIMTDSSLPSGSDRVWAAVKDKDVDVVINIQGDEPLVNAAMIDGLVDAFKKDLQIEMATLGKKIQADELSSMNIVKIVVNQNHEALYFSRFPIPYSRVSADFTNPQLVTGCLKHIGMYGYRKSFLQKFCQSPLAVIELNESLEQLRALYLGARIKVIETDVESIGVDTLEDVEKVSARSCFLP
jgi:3-deoxy-manno-octulosonate cytidylyltransferase (CMP-KDO synthetase)